MIHLGLRHATPSRVQNAKRFGGFQCINHQSINAPTRASRPTRCPGRPTHAKCQDPRSHFAARGRDGACAVRRELPVRTHQNVEHGKVAPNGTRMQQHRPSKEDPDAHCDDTDDCDDAPRYANEMRRQEDWARAGVRDGVVQQEARAGGTVPRDAAADGAAAGGAAVGGEARGGLHVSGDGDTVASSRSRVVYALEGASRLAWARSTRERTRARKAPVEATAERRGSLTILTRCTRVRQSRM